MYLHWTYDRVKHLHSLTLTAAVVTFNIAQPQMLGIYVRTCSVFSAAKTLTQYIVDHFWIRIINGVHAYHDDIMDSSLESRWWIFEWAWIIYRKECEHPCIKISISGSSVHQLMDKGLQILYARHSRSWFIKISCAFAFRTE